MHAFQESVVDDAAPRDAIANGGGQMAGKARAFFEFVPIGAFGKLAPKAGARRNPLPPSLSALAIQRRCKFMPKLRFDIEPHLRGIKPANDHDADMSSASNSTARPCLVTLESGIQALVEIAGLTYIDGFPLAIGKGVAEDVNPSDWLERGPDGIRLKHILTPV